MELLESQNQQFVFIDLEGTASVLVSRFIALADFVIIPVAGERSRRPAGRKSHSGRKGRGKGCATIQSVPEDTIHG